MISFSNVKYLYFEIHKTMINGENVYETIENENALLFKPHTNSSGVWGFRTITGRDNSVIGKHDLVIDQNWVDLNKFDMTKRYGINDHTGDYNEIRNYVSNFLEKIKNEHEI